MSVPDFPVIETSGGDRPPNTVAERGGLVLAVIALAGGLLIALGNLLGSAAGPSASASPVAQTTPRPTPDPGPREIILVAGVPPSTAPWEPQVWQFNGWIRALVDQPIWTSPDSDRAETTELLHAGEIRYAEEVPEEPGWLHVSSDGGPPGFVVTADGDTALVQRITPEPAQISGEVWTLAAGPNGFVASGNLPGMSGRGSPWFSAFSPDGASWQITDLPSQVTSIAWGPAGWLAATWAGDQTAPPTTWIYRSQDGLHWNSLGMAPGLDYAGQLVGSQSGYLMEASGFRYGSWSRWFSTDGLAWIESNDPLLGGDIEGGSPRTASVGSGFYAWIEGDQPTAIRRQAFSADGRTWDEIVDGPTGVNLRITTVGDRIIAAVTDPEDGSLHLHTGQIDGTRLRWSGGAPAGVEVSYPGLGLAALVSDGQRAVAILWERATDAMAAYSSPDGQTWTPRALPADAFGGIPRLAAGGSAGVVVVGAQYSPRGSNPTFWREIRPGRWEAEASPLIPVVHGPSADDCPAPFEDVVDFMVADRATAVVCFGDAPMTFRAWSAGCADCQPGGSGQYEPAWLADLNAGPLYLSPMEGDNGNWQQVAIGPDLVIDPAWTRAWIEVTGHFDDPAATSCRWTPSVAEESYYTGQFWFVDGCRQQFVVTAVRVVDGP